MRRGFFLLNSFKTQIAVVGSGPSGCYVADQLLKKIPDVHVDIYERLPVPFGLVRYGVAPDHPEVKNVEAKFLSLLESPNVTWLGGVQVGKDVPIGLLRDSYAAVVFATGADENKNVGIPGENLANVFSARSFVNYYNTLPSPIGNPFLCHFDTKRTKKVAIIGNGNVAIDVARVLSAPYKHWCPTDMNCRAVRELMDSSVSEITIIARRAEENAAFTTAEFRELCGMENVRVDLQPFDLEGAIKRSDGSRARRRMLELMQKNIMSSELATNTDRRKRVISFLFQHKPIRFVPSKERSNFVGGVLCDVDGAEKLIAADVVFTSVGYRSSPVRGAPFDNVAGVIPNSHGRVVDADHAVATGLYCSGWVKRGPHGVILHAMVDAQETVGSIVTDLKNNVLTPTTSQKGKFALIDYLLTKNVLPVTLEGAKRVFSSEKKKGIDLGKRIEKSESIPQMRDIAHGGEIGKLADQKFRGLSGARPEQARLLTEFLDDTTDMSAFAQDMSTKFPLLFAQTKMTPTNYQGDTN